MCASAQGFDVAKKALLEFLDKFKTEVDPADREVRDCAPAAACKQGRHQQQPQPACAQAVTINLWGSRWVGIGLLDCPLDISGTCSQRGVGQSNMLTYICSSVLS